MQRTADRRWLILVVIAIAQLMVVLDVTIVNIALPSAQQDLGFSDDDRQWVITAYALAFGSLLLLGGRIGDYFGRKWTFIAGLLGFAGASAVGGAAQSFDVLVAARAAQGVFGALLAAVAGAHLLHPVPAPARPRLDIPGALSASAGLFALVFGLARAESDGWSDPVTLGFLAVDGYVTAFWWAAGIFALGALVCGALLRGDTRPAPAHGGPEPAPAHT